MDKQVPITLDQLRVFLCVVEEGSFSAAARRLRRVQSAVSHAIAGLEQLLGVTLFDRSSRVPVLTGAGEVLLRDADAIAEQVTRLCARARVIAGGTEPQLSIAIDVIFPIQPLLAAIAGFQVEFPATPLALYTEALGAVAQQVIDGVCGIGISGPLPSYPRQIEVRPLFASRMVAVAAADHPLARAEQPVVRAQLREYPQLVLTDRSALTEGYETGVLGGATWSFVDMSTRQACLRAGFGWCYMPYHMIDRDLAAGRLRVLDLAHAGQEMRHVHSILFRAGTAPGPAAEWFAGKLRECGCQTPGIVP